MGYRENHQYSLIDDKISDYYRVHVIVASAKCEDRYLRNIAVEHNDFLETEIDTPRNHQPEGTESESCEYAAKLSTKASLLLCDNDMRSMFYCEAILTRTSVPRIRQCKLSCCVPVSEKNDQVRFRWLGYKT